GESGDEDALGDGGDFDAVFFNGFLADLHLGTFLFLGFLGGGARLVIIIFVASIAVTVEDGAEEKDCREKSGWLQHVGFHGAGKSRNGSLLRKCPAPSGNKKLASPRVRATRKSRARRSPRW